MFKFLVALGLVAVLANVEAAANTCEAVGSQDSFKNIDWKSMNNTECVSYTKDQIRMEIQASYAYLALAAHFSKDTVNRPGFANFFFTAAGEEREHGMKLIEYMLMRGELTNEAGVPNLKELKFNGYVTIDDMPGVYEGTSTASGLDALKAALKLEVKVTNSIKELIKKCEGNDEDKAALNDYHFVDYLTGDFLEEQYHGQRELAGKISTLSKMILNSPSPQLAEFLFDKKNM